MSANASPSRDESTEDKLENEIATLRARIDSLKRDLQLQASTLMTPEIIKRLIRTASSSSSSSTSSSWSRRSSTRSRKSERENEKLRARAERHAAHRQQCLYRTCAPVTSFRVRDPDPRAVDGGRVLGLRFEVMARARFVRPYFVLLNRPYPDSPRHLRVHRHTVPPCIPLSGLAARHLPPPRRPAGAGDAEGRQGAGRGGGDYGDDGHDGNDDEDHDDGDDQHRQDLARFARALRRELVRYHNRTSVITDLRKAAGLDSAGGDGGSKKRAAVGDDGDDDDAEQGDGLGSHGPAMLDISAADAEAKQITMQWADGRSGRLVIGDDGDILKMAVQGGSGRDRETVRRLLGGSARVEEIAGRLAGEEN
ncbi:cenp-O kinetochore centromere component [Xylariomycetidae sp. FL2044]|nr:cenp-O kinetochore centromere component [Xylariomycetidae sp. FL2044]